MAITAITAITATTFTTTAAGLQQAIPFKQEVAAGADGWSRLGGAMLVCIAVLGLVLYLLRRHLKLPPQARALQRLQVLETRRLGPRSHLHVVQFGGREHLIGSSEQGLVVLASSALPDQADGIPGANHDAV